MKTNFKIEHIDPLGQGVSRLNDQVTFIGKTLPEETGQAKVIRRAKGVQFAFYLCCYVHYLGRYGVLFLAGGGPYPFIYSYYLRLGYG